MANPSQALVLRFNTDLAKAQKDIGQFAAQAYLNFEKVSSYAKNAATALDFLGKNAGKIAIGGAIAASALVAVGAFEAFTSAVYNAKEALDELTKIGSSAKSAGVGTTFFQSWTQQAKDLGLETSDLIGMLEKARAAATETIGENGGTSKSVGGDRIKQNVLAGNLSGQALASFDAADTQEARIRVVLGLLDQLQAKGLRLAEFDLANKFFGPTFESQLRDGVDMIGKMRQALDGLGAACGARIIPKEEIENAQFMQAELDAINDKLAKGTKPILDDIAKIQQDSLQSLIKAKDLWADLIVTIGYYYSELKAHIRELGEGFGILSPQQLPRPQGHPGEDQVPAITVHGDKSKPLPSLTPAAAKTAASPTDQVDTYIKSLQKLAAAEAAEAETLGLGNKAKQEAVDLARAQEAAAERGTSLTQKERDTVKQLADAYIEAKDRIEAFNKAQESAKATGDFFGQTLEGAIEKLAIDGGKLKDVLLDVVKALEQAALKAVLLGEGPLGNLFGTAPAAGATGTSAIGGLFGQGLGAFAGSGFLSGLFGLPASGLFAGGFAAGGSIPSGHFGLVGENGPELIQGPAAVTPFRAIDAALSAGGGRSGSHAVAMMIDVRGARGNAEIQEMIASGVNQGMKAVHSKIARDIGPLTIAWNKRFG